MDKKDQILDLYFNKHLQQTEISKQLDVSQQYISKIVKKDERYKQEKDYRKLKMLKKEKFIKWNIKRIILEKKIMISHLKHFKHN